jgi:hypothetical protein
MTIDTMMPEVGDVYAVCVDAILSEICKEQVIDANPRTPYLVLAWHLVGSDNENRLNKEGKLPFLIRLLALMSIYIACGAFPQVRKLQRIANHANKIFDIQQTTVSRQVAWVAETLCAIATIDNRFDIEESQWVYSMAIAEYPAVIEKARDWCYIDDVSAGQIIQKLMLDCLPT